MNRINSRLRTIIHIGLFAALVFVFTFLRIDIPTPLGKTMLHLGNVMCQLAGYMLGGLSGGLAAGIGSMLFDLFDPVFAPECWITFIMKFCLGFAAGFLANAAFMKRLKFFRYIVAAVVSALTYFALYMAKTFIVEHWVKGFALETVLVTMATKGVVSAVNGAVASVASVLLILAIAPAMRRADPDNSMGLKL